MSACQPGCRVYPCTGDAPYFPTTVTTGTASGSITISPWQPAPSCQHDYAPFPYTPANGDYYVGRIFCRRCGDVVKVY